jgi:hypothetical protein
MVCEGKRGRQENHEPKYVHIRIYKECVIEKKIRIGSCESNTKKIQVTEESCNLALENSLQRLGTKTNKSSQP